MPRKLTRAEMLKLDPVRGLNIREASDGTLKVPNDSGARAMEEYYWSRRVLTLLKVVDAWATGNGTGTTDYFPIQGMDLFNLEVKGDGTAFSFKLRGSIDGASFYDIGAAITANGAYARGALGQMWNYILFEFTDAPDAGSVTVNMTAVKG